jgi:uncharacterized protein (TIGR02646 family)
MIRIDKPAAPPDILTMRGIAHRDELCAAFDRDEKPTLFRDSIYAHSSVKAALKDAQRGKCCFCERRIGDDSDVEHFRPKGGWKQQAGDRTSEIGYFWLAYDWANLLLCCGDCNSRHKGNLFPLADPTERADPTTRDISTEDPLFINPSERDPADYIGFREEYACAIDGNLYGATTIDALGLNARENIVADRRDRLQLVRMVQTLIEITKRLEDIPAVDSANPQYRELLQLVEDLRVYLRQRVSTDDPHLFLTEARLPHAPFMAMIRVALPEE